jgi:hypothetical protein
MNVAEFLTEHADAILSNAVESLGRAHIARYEQTGSGEARLRALFEVVVRCCAERHLGPVLDHAERIARERYAAGYDLGEVQTAINVLEEAAWRAILEHAPAADQGESLGILATVLGAAKDRLASTYVSLAAHKTTPTLKLEGLFKGTVGASG